MKIILDINLYSLFSFTIKFGTKKVRKINPYIDKFAAVTSENLNVKYKQ
tara:strand:- start:30 stop:176 length:147 start_codon:yes stop_codon:yes gene_type:complete